VRYRCDTLDVPQQPCIEEPHDASYHHPGATSRRARLPARRASYGFLLAARLLKSRPSCPAHAPVSPASLVFAVLACLASR
jgi:hypothetical protein